tara:strand:- start:450 stop:713 length:264 start_codon:yes stop_codon:yes gene_type:complete
MVPPPPKPEWSEEDQIRFHQFLKSDTGVVFAASLRHLIFSEAQRQVTATGQSSDWRVGFACGVQSAVAYIDMMGDVLENEEDETHDN